MKSSFIFQNFKKFDLIAPCDSLKVECSKNFKTNFGAFLTISTFILIILSAISIGGEIFQRKQPKVIERNLFEKYAPFLNLNEKNYSFAISITDDHLRPIENLSNYFFIEYRLLEIERLFDRYDANIQNRNFTNCTNKESISDDLSEKSILKLPGLLCLDIPEMHLKNNWNSNKLKYLSFSITKCQGSDCYNETEIDKLIDSYLLINIYLTETNINNQDYKKPISKRIDRYYYVLSKDTLKKLNLYIKKIKVISDDGLFLENIYSEESVQVGKKEIDTAKLASNKPIFIFFMYSSSDTLYIYRYYTKIQNILAELGGIISFFFILLKAILFFYKINERDINFINHMFEYDIDKLSENLNENKKNNVRSTINKKTKIKKKNSNDKIVQETIKIKDNLSNYEKKDNKKKFEFEINKDNYNANNEDSLFNMSSPANENINSININVIDLQDKKLKIEKVKDKRVEEKKYSFYDSVEKKNSTYNNTYSLNFFEKLLPLKSNCLIEKKKKNYLIRLQKILYSISGLPNYFKLLQDLENLKYLLLSKDQLAFFNYICLNSNVKLVDCHYNFLPTSNNPTDYHKFQNEVELFNFALEFSEIYANKNNKNEVDKKLFGLLNKTMEKKLKIS